MANTKFTIEYAGTTYTAEDDLERVRADIEKAVQNGGGLVTVATTEDFEAESPRQLDISSADDVVIIES